MIRDYNQSDADQIVEIWRSSSAVAHPFLPNEFIETEASNLRNIYLGLAETRVMEINGTIVGFIAMLGTEIGGLFLHPQQHGQGLGWAMVSDAMTRLGSLSVEVFEQNEIGRKFYAACGFRHLSTSIHEQTGEPIMKLSISHASIAQKQ